MDRVTKEQVVSELHEKLKTVNLAILADYSGMTVAQITDLRNQLRKSHGEMRVVKNNLLGIASENTDFSPLNDHLRGPMALIVSSGDVVTATKAITEFAKKNEKFEIKVGVLDGTLLDTAQIKVLADLPGRDVLMANLLSVMVGVQSRFVNVLAGVPRQFVQVIEAYRVKKEQAN
ncbi:MAG: 50S ribosomal protein L10 [Deltaproteobacteria bacterium]|nr:50S ribosomal protein L10 [Deltaproteobacteria bacterium]